MTPLRTCIIFCCLIGAAAPGAIAANSQERMCASPLLIRPDQDACHREIAKADSVTELRKIQKKYRDRIRKAEEAQKAAKKD